MTTAKTLTTQQLDLISKLEPVIALASQMILAGTLSKNVVKHFTNKGWSIEAATNVVEMAEFRASKFMKYKSK